MTPGSAVRTPAYVWSLNILNLREINADERRRAHWQSL